MVAASFACAVIIKVRGASLGEFVLLLHLYKRKMSLIRCLCRHSGALASGDDKVLHMTGTIWSSCMMACDISITVTSMCRFVDRDSMVLLKFPCL